MLNCVLEETSRLTYRTAAWFQNENDLRSLEKCWSHLWRDMFKGGWEQIETDA